MSGANCEYCNDTGIDEMTDAYNRFVRCERCPAGIQAEINNQLLIIESLLSQANKHFGVLKEFMKKANTHDA